eukprot:TRINITY_DN4055_c0_g1_i1.p1 TRINITY_DN4055_c0_g1~~TRINITY_DN4055_c0_g1_i1.p1  ORF type:complete len:619 (-),score=189.25 TRINITY_DN4055_c0_g1_i1:1697-3553(-)
MTISETERNFHSSNDNSNVEEEEEEEEEETGGQREPLYIRISNLLKHEYKDGSQFRECIQNADDSGANLIEFTLDEHEYSRETTRTPNLKKQQGPALCIYNDGFFSEKDWKKIKTPGDSGKKEDLTVTGQFGLGFNSVYHVTDTPIICSGKKLSIFDPREVFLEKKHDGGITIPVSLLERKYPDQLEPIKACGKIVDDSFNGTLFRLPLRNDPTSKLKGKIVEPAQILESMRAFQLEAPLALIFLKNIKSIELFKREKNQERKRIFSVSIQECDSTDRRGLHDRIKDIQEKSTSSRTEWNQSYLNHFKLSIKIIDDENSTELTQNWLISDILTEGELAKFAGNVSGDEKLKLIPSVRTACSLDPNPSAGRAFSLLPLPFEDKLKGIHISGSFQLKPDRAHIYVREEKGIFTPEEDMRVCWNEKLLQFTGDFLAEHVFPTLVGYFNLNTEDLNHFYEMFPQELTFSPWNHITKRFYEKLDDSKENLYWDSHSKRLRSLQEGYFPSNTISTVIIQMLKRRLCFVIEISNLVQHLKNPNKIDSSVLRKYFQVPNNFEEETRENLNEALRFAIVDGKYSELYSVYLLPLSSGKWIPFNKRDHFLFTTNGSKVSELNQNLRIS